MNENLADLLDFRANAHPDRPALNYKGKNYTYHEIAEISKSAALYLIEMGIQKNDRFAIFDFNTASALFLWLGASYIGAVPVFVNWRFSLPELDYILKDSAAKVLFYGSDFEKIVSGLVSPELIIVKISEFQISDIFFSTKSQTDIKDSQFNKVFTANLTGQYITADDVMIQLYTSGTTGYPRGVVLTHRSMFNMISGISTELPGIGPGTANMVAGPLFNIAGAGYIVLGFYNGTTNFMIEKFDAKQVAQDLVNHKISNVFLAPAMIHAILQIPGIEKSDFSSLINIHYGGSPMPFPVLKKARSVFQCDFTQGYGLTETSGITTLLRYDDHRRAMQDETDEDSALMLQSAGRPVSGMKIKIVNSSGMELPVGEIGEVWIRGGNMMAGYWNRKESAIDSDGWFHSGDIAKIDKAGFLYLLDRKNDMIISGGINIYPAEIERVIELHPAVKEAAVIGIPDEKFGERVCAYIVKSEKEIDQQNLQEWCRGKIADFKIPFKIIFIENLPRNPSGKVLRRELRKLFSEQNQGALT
jgi:long-chain acyl-CoA synthetase